MSSLLSLLLSRLHEKLDVSGRHSDVIPGLRECVSRETGFHLAGPPSKWPHLCLLPCSIASQNNGSCVTALRKPNWLSKWFLFNISYAIMAYHVILNEKWVSFVLSFARKYRQGEEMQMNMVQNPFPDLFPSECLLPWTKNSATQVNKKKEASLVLNSLLAHFIVTAVI